MWHLDFYKGNEQHQMSLISKMRSWQIRHGPQARNWNLTVDFQTLRLLLEERTPPQSTSFHKDHFISLHLLLPYGSPMHSNHVSSLSLPAHSSPTLSMLFAFYITVVCTETFKFTCLHSQTLLFLPLQWMSQTILLNLNHQSSMF